MYPKSWGSIAHTRLSLPENTSDDIIHRRAIKNLRLITKGAAAQTLDVMLSSSLEWRSEQQVAAVRARGEQVISLLRKPGNNR
ncbi:unnamed protein product [Ectocarpus sp. CCAP 1310/34]|nr:unnamed protein product [Ectocarpus sp. CCAP 1310/34]